MQKKFELAEKILRLNPADFENMIADILKFEYPELKSFNQSGSSAVARKTIKGKPDIWFVNKDNKLVLVEITTQTTRLDKKIKDDIKKCNEYANNREVDSLIYACTKAVGADKFLEYEALAKESGIGKLIFWSIDELIRLLSFKYANIAKEYLGVYLQKGSVKTLEEFQNNKFATSQEHKFSLRKEDLKEVKKLLKENGAVVLYGEAGCGKTRLAIEIAKSMKNYKKLVVDYQGISLIEDLATELSKDLSKEHIVIIDDANRNNYFKDIVNLVDRFKNAKLLVTTRDYGVEKFSEYYMPQYKVETFNNEDLTKVIGIAFKEFSNELIHHIVMLSRGNLRIAIMAAYLYKNNKKIDIKNINELVEQHFKSVDKDNNIFESATNEEKKVLAIASFMQRFGLAKPQYVGELDLKEQLLGLMKVGYEELISALKFWEEKEVLNLRNDPIIVEIADQVLGSYIFKKFVIDEKLIQFSDIIKAFYNVYPNRVRDMIQSLLYITERNVITDIVKEVWKEMQTKDEDTAIDFIVKYALLIQEDAILYADKILSNISEDRLYPNKEEISKNYFTGDKYNKLIGMLLEFEGTPCDEYALETLFDLLDKNNDFFLEIQKKLENNIISKDSYYNKYGVQILLYQKILSNIKNPLYKDIFLSITKKHIKHSHQVTWSNRGGTITMSQINIAFNEFGKEYRNLLWSGLKSLTEKGEHNDDVIEILREFRNSFHNIGDEEFRKYESEKFLEIVELLLTDKSYYLRVYKLFDRLEIVGSSKTLLKLEKNEVIKLYKDLIQYNEIQYNDSEYKDYIFKYLSEYEKLDEFLIRISNIYGPNTHSGWILSKVVANYFDFIEANHTNELFNYFKLYVENTNADLINPSYILSKLIKYESVDDIYSYIKSKDELIPYFYVVLKKDDINELIYKECLNFFKTQMKSIIKPLGNLSIINLRQYEEYKEGFILELMKSILADTEFKLTYFYESLFYEARDSKKDVIEELNELLDNDYNIIKSAYFKILKSNGHFYDPENKIIKYLATKDMEILYEYVNILLKSRSHSDDIKFVLEYENFDEIILTILDRKDQLFWGFYNIESRLIKAMSFEQLKKFIESYYNKFKDNHSRMFYFVNLFNDMLTEKQYYMVDYLIENKYDIEEFKKMPLFSGPSSAWGSWVPLYKKTLSDLNNYIDGIKLNKDNVNYIQVLKTQTKNYIENRVKSTEARESNDDFRF